MKTANEWKKFLIKVEETTNDELKDIEYVSERIQTISDNIGEEDISEAECLVLAREISKSI